MPCVSTIEWSRLRFLSICSQGRAGYSDSINLNAKVRVRHVFVKQNLLLISQKPKSIPLQPLTVQIKQNKNQRGHLPINLNAKVRVRHVFVKQNTLPLHWPSINRQEPPPRNPKIRELSASLPHQCTTPRRPAAHIPWSIQLKSQHQRPATLLIWIHVPAMPCRTSRSDPHEFQSTHNSQIDCTPF
jgi:hypothetical protein